MSIDDARAVAENAAREVETKTYSLAERAAIKAGDCLAAAQVKASDAARAAGQREFQRVYWENLG